MAVAEFDQKDANLITLNHHEIFFSYGGTFGREKNDLFCQWNELLNFLADVFPSNAAILEPMSEQVRWLMNKMRENGDMSHSVTYIRSISMSGNRHKILKEALLVDIWVATEMLNSGLFASNAQNLAHCRL